MKLNRELEKIFKEEGFDAHIYRERNDFFIEFCIYTPENEEREEKLYIGEGRIHDVAIALNRYYDSFDRVAEFIARKDEIGEEGYPQTVEDLDRDIAWYEHKLDSLTDRLGKFYNCKESALLTEKERTLD